MKKFLDKLWASPFAVKISFAFLFFVFLVALIADPGRVIFAVALIYSVFRIIDWFWGTE